MRMPRDRLVSTIFGNTCDGLIPRRFGVTPKFANLTSAKACTPSRSPHLRARAHRQSSRASPTFVRRGGCSPHLPGIPAQPWRHAARRLLSSPAWYPRTTMETRACITHAAAWLRYAPCMHMGAEGAQDNLHKACFHVHAFADASSRAPRCMHACDRIRALHAC